MPPEADALDRGGELTTRATGDQLFSAAGKRRAGPRILTGRQPGVELRSVEARPDTPQRPVDARDTRRGDKRSSRQDGHVYDRRKRGAKVA